SRTVSSGPVWLPSVGASSATCTGACVHAVAGQPVLAPSRTTSPRRRASSHPSATAGPGTGATGIGAALARALCAAQAMERPAPAAGRLGGIRGTCIGRGLLAHGQWHVRADQILGPDEPDAAIRWPVAGR